MSTHLSVSRSIITTACLMIALLGIEIRRNAYSFPISQKSKDARQAGTISSDDDLAKVIADLDKSETRLHALARLITFASPKLYQVGSMIFINSDPKIDALQDKAAKTVREHTNIETIEAALDSSDPELQFWGVICWRGGNGSQGGAPDQWLSLLPKIKKLAIDGDERTRSFAIQRLQLVSEGKGFLAERLKVETSPDIIAKLVYQQDRAEFSRRLNPLLLKLLDHTDEVVRRQTLDYIGSNYLSAEMWQIDFDVAIFDKTLEKTFVESERERASAVNGLTGIRNLDLTRSREAFIRLAKDESDDVRSRIAWGFRDQLQHEDVKPVIANLLKDSSPIVQYMTILVVGPENFLNELKMLARSSDPRVSEWASAKLEQLSKRKRPK
jgi:hypothetical protein